MIRAVVLDIGSVLEIVDDAVFPAPFERRHGLAPGAVAGAGDWPRDALLGQMTEAETRAHWQARLGPLDRLLFDWFAGLRARGLRTGILSNSGPGAREAERHYGFEAVTDDIVY